MITYKTNYLQDNFHILQDLNQQPVIYNQYLPKCRCIQFNNYPLWGRGKIKEYSHEIHCNGIEQRIANFYHLCTHPYTPREDNLFTIRLWFTLSNALQISVVYNCILCNPIDNFPHVILPCKRQLRARQEHSDPTLHQQRTSLASQQYQRVSNT